MNNDLISREALKKAITNQYNLNDPPTLYWWTNINKIIDNAPTVDIKDELAGAYNEGYMCGNKEEKARPQGEWNYIQAGMCVCPFCGAMPHKLYKNYCAKCGAELKGGAE